MFNILNRIIKACVLACVSALVLHAVGKEPPFPGFGRINYPFEKCSPQDQAFFRDTLVKIKSKREELLVNRGEIHAQKGKRKEQENQEVESGSKLNVACLAVCLFDEGKIPLCNKVFFGHKGIGMLTQNMEAFKAASPLEDKTEVEMLYIQQTQCLKTKLEQPYYFASGRFDKVNFTDISDTDCLFGNKCAKLIELLECLEDSELSGTLGKECEHFTPKNVSEAFYKSLPVLERDWFAKLATMLPRAQKAKSNEVPDKKHCNIFPKTGIKITDTNTVPFAKAYCNKETHDHVEQVFTHSEQLIWTRFSGEMKDFFIWIMRIYDIKKEVVDRVSLYVPTWNSMCARCAYSCLLDLNENPTNLKSVISAIFDKIIRTDIYVPAHVKCETTFRKQDTSEDIQNATERYWDAEYEDGQDYDRLLLQVMTPLPPQEQTSPSSSSSQTATANPPAPPPLQEASDNVNS